MVVVDGEEVGGGVVCGGGGGGGGGSTRTHRGPDYLGTRARAQNQTQCHWGRSIGGGLRSVFGASSSSGQGGSGGLQGKERQRQTITATHSPCVPTEPKSKGDHIERPFFFFFPAA